MPRQVVLERDEFEYWVAENSIRIVVPRPFDLVPCHCGDVNCHGWRFVESVREARPVFDIGDPVHA